MGQGWYQSGFPTDEQFSQIASASRKAPRRFWLPPSKSCKVVFLDDNPFCVWEHNLKLNGSFRNWFTCRLGFEENATCPMCDAMRTGNKSIKRIYTGFLTMLDVTGWKTDKGELVKNQRQLYPMGVETLKRIRVIKHKKTTLVGAMFDVTRTGDKSPGCGDMWDFIKYVDPFKDESFFFHSRMENKMKAPEVFDYQEMFKAISAQEMKTICSSGAYAESEGESDDSTHGGGDEDSIY